MELGTWPGPVTKIRYRWVCERPVDLLLNLGTLSKRTIYRYAAEPMYTWPQNGKIVNVFMVARLDWSTRGRYSTGIEYEYLALEHETAL